jgi:hypothetical protein
VVYGLWKYDCNAYIPMPVRLGLYNTSANIASGIVSMFRWNGKISFCSGNWVTLTVVQILTRDFTLHRAMWSLCASGE